MNRATKTIEHGGVTLTVSEASVLQGYKRRRLAAEAVANETDQGRLLVRAVSYADLVAATVEAAGLPWPISFAGWLNLDEGLLLKWETAVYDLNPHWVEERRELWRQRTNEY